MENKKENKIKNRGNRVKSPVYEIIKKYNQKYGDNRFFLYSTTINHKQIFENEWWDLDVIDVCIFSAISAIIGSGFCSRKEDTKGLWYNVTEHLIISYVPLIGISNISAIAKRIVKLEKYKLIEKNPKNFKGGKKWIRLGKNSQKMFFFKDKEKEDTKIL